MHTLYLLFLIFFFWQIFPVCSAYAEDVIKSDSDLTTELWEGRVLTARFKAGMCFERDGKARGVLILKHMTGKEDTYHLYGSIKNNSFELSHSSGHYFNGELTDPENMAGKVKLSNGMNLTLKGHRTRNVTLKAPDCAPLN